MYFTEEKNCYSECYKKVLYASPKSARKILTNLSPTYNSELNSAHAIKP